MDELAALTNRDPVEFRLGMLEHQPRMVKVLELAAEKAGWGTPMDTGRGQGVSMCEQRGTFIAQVAEVSVQDDDTWSVDRVVTAVDCGLIINPDIVRAHFQARLR
jgi:isoquinoline 1-oxidoreductase beta subunit